MTKDFKEQSQNKHEALELHLPFPVGQDGSVRRQTGKTEVVVVDVLRSQTKTKTHLNPLELVELLR